MSRVTKIILLVEIPFSERNYNRYGIEILQKNGFDVEVWEFTPFLRPDVHEQVKVPDPVAFSGYRKFSARADALAAIAQLPASCFVLSLIVYRYGTMAIYRALSAARVRYGVVWLSALPSASAVTQPLTMLVSILAKVRHASRARLWKVLLGRIPFQLLGIRPASVMLAGGEGALRFKRVYPVNGRTTILWAHARDYDVYLNEKEKPVQTDAKVGVFLDENVPFHPEHNKEFWPYAAPCNEDEYYPGLRRFFDFLERERGVRVIIAAHPSARYDEGCDYFGPRTIVQGRTLELVRQAAFVISHNSTALTYAILFDKPVLFIDNDKMRRNLVDAHQTNGIAQYLKRLPINLDTPLRPDWEKELTVDRDAYAQYRETFIKRHGSPEKHSSQILADFVKTLE